MSIEPVEGDRYGARAEREDQALLLVGFDASASRVIEPSEEAAPSRFDPLVAGRGIRDGSHQRAPSMADANHPGEGLGQQRNRIPDACDPGGGPVEDLVLHPGVQVLPCVARAHLLEIGMEIPF